MTAYFGFEPTPTLKADIEKLLANLANKSPESQYQLSNEIAKLFTDETIDNLFIIELSRCYAASWR